MMRNESARYSRWWREDDHDDCLPCLWKEVDRISDDYVDREQMVLDTQALYGISSGALNQNIFEPNEAFSELRHNVIATATDALVTEVTTQVAKPMAVPTDGDFVTREKCKSLTQFFDAKWKQQKIHEVEQHATRDSILCGMGCVRVSRANELKPRHDTSIVERITPLNLLMDDRGKNAMPRQFYVRFFVERAHLADLFPDKEEEIWNAQNRDRAFYAHPDRLNTWVEVIEAVHLESAPGNEDGRRLLAIRNCILVDQKKMKEHENPYVFIRCILPTEGFWGEPLVLRAAPSQTELNKLSRRTQQSMHLHAVPRVFVERQSDIVDTHINNDIGVIIEYDGQPPHFMTPPSMSGEVYSHMERLEQWGFKNMAVNELQASGHGTPKNMRLEGGPSFRAFLEMQTGRWINFVRGYEEMSEQIAFKVAMTERAIAKEYSGHRVSTLKGDTWRNFRWKDIEVDPENFAIQVQAASALPKTPAGKLAALEEWVKTGVIDQQTFVRLADVPDMDSVRSLMFAADDLLDQLFARMLTEEDYYKGPEPGLDWVKAKAKAQLEYFRAMVEEVPWERRQKLIRFIEECDAAQDLEMQKEMERQLEAQRAAEETVGLGPPGPPGMAPGPGPLPPGGGMPGPGGPGPLPPAPAPGGLDQMSMSPDMAPPPNLDLIGG